VEIIAKSYLEEFSLLHELKMKDVLHEAFANAYAELGLDEAECLARSQVQIHRLNAKIENWHVELLDLVGAKKND
jgi:cytoskeletal protein RodZ